MLEKDNGLSTDDFIGRFARALGHPYRRKILRALMREPGSATSLSRAFDDRLGSIAYHLIEILYKECDVVEVVQVNQRRGANEKVFILKPDAFVGGIDWSEVLEPVRSGLRGVGLCYFQDAAIAALKAEIDKPDKDSAYACRPIRVDEAGKCEIGEAVKEFIGKVKSVEDRCSDADPGGLMDLMIGVAAFEPAPPPVDGDDG